MALDKLSHAAIVDGIYMAQGMNPDIEVRYFKHNPRFVFLFLWQLIAGNV